MKYLVWRISITGPMLVAVLACSSSSGEATPAATQIAPTEPPVTQTATPMTVTPPAPDNVFAGTPFDINAVFVNWEYSADSTVTFEVERAPSENGPWVHVDEVRFSTQNVYMDHGLCSGDSYWYRMFAVQDGVRSSPSNVASGVAANVMPGLPTPETCIKGSEEP